MASIGILQSIWDNKGSLVATLFIIVSRFVVPQAHGILNYIRFWYKAWDEPSTMSSVTRYGLSQGQPLWQPPVPLIAGSYFEAHSRSTC